MDRIGTKKKKKTLGGTYALWILTNTSVGHAISGTAPGSGPVPPVAVTKAARARKTDARSLAHVHEKLENNNNKRS
jgi:hypothetical protein